MKTLATNRAVSERYNTSKLLQLMMMRKLAAASSASAGPAVTINALNPGLCRTQLFRQLPLPVRLFMNLACALAGREPEMGSRTLMMAALAGDDTHGQWMTDCKMHRWPAVMLGEDGERVTDQFWGELVEVLEGIQPGVTANI